MLGLTVGCARCHDHKFDPITQKDFYQLFAFFGNVNEKGVYTETRGNVPPMIKATTPENEKKLAEFDAKIGTLDKQLKDHIASIGPHRAELIDAIAKMSSKNEPVASVEIPLQKESGTVGHVGVTGGAVTADATSAAPTWKDELFGQAAEFDGKQHLDYPL